MGVMGADRDGACPRCDLEYGHDEPCNRPVGEVPPNVATIDTHTWRPIGPDPHQALLTQLHEARADRQRTAEENRDLLAENLRLRAAVAPRWRSVPSDLPPDPVEAFSRGRNWMIDRLRALLDGEVRP